MKLEILEDWLNNPEPVGELAEVELLEKVTEQQVIQGKTTKLKSIAEWKLSATEEEYEDGMGDHDDLPICRKEMQLRRLHGQSHPLQQLDKVVEDIRRLMLISTETASKERLGRKAAVVAAEQQKQQQQRNGADEQL
jgi:hypothetical protein